MHSFLRLRSFYRPPPRLPFKVIDHHDIEHFQGFLAPHQILTDPDDIAPFNTSWIKKERGHSKVVLMPNCQTQVAKILEHCNQSRIAVVPQGGNTGLVGGSVPLYDELILSLSKMDKILNFDLLSSVLSVEAGVILQKADEYLIEKGF